MAPAAQAPREARHAARLGHRGRPHLDRPARQQVQQARERLAQLGPGHDEVDVPEAEVRLRPPEVVGQPLAGRLLSTSWGSHCLRVGSSANARVQQPRSEP